MLSTLSKIFGWMYFLAWGLAQYPSLISNIKLRSVQGIAIDFMFFNTAGFLLYSLYTGSLLFSSTVREEFLQKYHKYPLIKLNDFIFGSHGLVLNLVLVSQAYFWGFKKNDNQRVSLVCKLSLTAVALYGFGSAVLITEHVHDMQWVELFTSFGLIKILMSICKNIPQILYNYNRKSTHGWPILMVWFDFAGSILSFLQLFLDAYIAGDLKAVFHNLPKLLLSLEVFITDVIFLAQHYYLYFENDVHEYGSFRPTSLGAILDEDEEFVVEHEHDHDHTDGESSVVVCHVNPTDKNEIQRLFP